MYLLLDKVIAINEYSIKNSVQILIKIAIFMIRWKNRSIRERECVTIPSFPTFFPEISIEMITSIVVDIVFRNVGSVSCRFPSLIITDTAKIPREMHQISFIDILFNGF